MGAPLGFTYTGNSTNLVVPSTFYHAYANRYKSTGPLYALEAIYTGRTTQKVIRSFDGGSTWTVLGELPVDIDGGEVLKKLFVEIGSETFYVLKQMDKNNDPYSHNILSYSLSGGTFTLIGTLDIGEHYWLNNSASIDSMWYTGGTVATMFAEYGRDDQTVMRVWKTVDRGANWTEMFSQTANDGTTSGGQVRHFHTLQVDPFTGHWWLSSGDADNQCKIWVSTDVGVNWTLVGGGSDQTTRLVGFVFESDYVYYAMDTPHTSLTTNIYRFTRDNFSGREVIGTQPENTSIRSMTRTFFPPGILFFPTIEDVSGGATSEQITIQFYSYADNKMHNLKPMSLLGETDGGFFDTSRYQCKWSGVVAGELLGSLSSNYTYDQFASTTIGSRLIRMEIAD